MKLQCPYCNQECETSDELADGQHVVCPFCNETFVYREARTPGAFCTKCGNKLNQGDAFCSKCGAATDGTANNNSLSSRQDKFFERIEMIERARYERELNRSDKSRVAYVFLGLFLGFLGIHNFYIGKTRRGVSQLIVTVIFGAITGGCALFAVLIWAIVDICTISQDGDGKRLA